MVQVIPIASQVSVYLSFPGTLKELENTFAFLAKKIAPPTPHLKVFPLPRREEASTRHKVLWLIPSLSYQPRSGEQEREKETVRGVRRTM